MSPNILGVAFVNELLALYLVIWQRSEHTVTGPVLSAVVNNIGTWATLGAGVVVFRNPCGEFENRTLLPDALPSRLEGKGIMSRGDGPGPNLCGCRWKSCHALSGPRPAS